MGWGRARFFLVFAFLLLFLAGTQAAFVDASRDGAYAASSILAEYPQDIVVGAKSADWRFDGRAAVNGPAFPGATNVGLAVTDFMHWARFWQMTFLSLGAVFLFWCGYYWPVNLRAFTRFALGLGLLVVGHLAYLGGHDLLWNYVLPKDANDIAQAAAKPWVDWFIVLHSDLQARGILG
ncbi:MAG: hypothetical protein KDJ77_10690 [Rhodobiaceae bacterium]|nr:hypothetical protein [Rhodobiaceae bacterium]